VYVRSRKRTKEIAKFLADAGISASFYHAGLAIEDKEDKQQKWKNDECRVMVATNAFGMGIDKPNVRVVVHMDLPSSLEEYYQEAGRAGRDGKPSFAVVLASKRDRATLKRRVSDSFPNKEFIRRVYELACNFVEVPVGGGYNQVYDFNSALFCDRFKLPSVQTHSALRLLSQAGYFEYVENVNVRAKVMMLANRDELYSFHGSDQSDMVLQYLLRSYTGLFADYVTISEASMAFRLNITEDAVYHALLELNREHVLHYIPRRNNPYLFFITSRELPKYIQIPISMYEDMRDRLEDRINAIEHFTFDSTECRANTILRYFGEKTDEECGSCDVCRDRRKHAEAGNEADILRQSIMYVASKPGGMPLTQLVAEVSANSNTALVQVRQLLDLGLITIDKNQIVKKK
ncbi:MAG: RecQ family zinc-binding domain-containing protein, partial [Muribaculaceae bacterium]|nr:RecQ family zinc-binding domain-containing protein [Muribaculaceae bacterium]